MTLSAKMKIDLSKFYDYIPDDDLTETNHIQEVISSKFMYIDETDAHAFWKWRSYQHDGSWLSYRYDSEIIEWLVEYLTYFDEIGNTK